MRYKYSLGKYFRRQIQRLQDPFKPYALADYCTVKEAAKTLHISPSGVYYRIVSGKIPAIRLGRQLLIKTIDLR